MYFAMLIFFERVWGFQSWKWINEIYHKRYVYHVVFVRYSICACIRTAHFVKKYVVSTRHTILSQANFLKEPAMYRINKFFFNCRHLRRNWIFSNYEWKQLLYSQRKSRNFLRHNFLALYRCYVALIWITSPCDACFKVGIRIPSHW